MISISLCMIVKDEEKVIGRCLESVKDVVDEFIIVDTGSRDKTKNILKKYTQNIFDFKWVDDFSAARNFSFSKATKDYIMWLDADDIINDTNKKYLMELKKDLDNSIDIVMMKYDVSFDENNSPNLTYYRERLVKRSKNYLWVGPVHEVIVPSGNIVYKDISIFHKKIGQGDVDRNLRIFENMIHQNKILDPRQKYYYARELYFHSQYEKAIDQFNEFLSEGNGWVENNIEACQILSKCYNNIGKLDDSINILFKSFLYDSPRAEICCDIGNYFLEQNKFEEAIFWYKTSHNLEYNDKKSGFKLLDCYGYIPFIQLCVCYDKLGDYKLAYEYNEKAGQIKPKSKAYLHNREYFKKIGL